MEKAKTRAMKSVARHGEQAHRLRLPELATDVSKVLPRPRGTWSISGLNDGVRSERIDNIWARLAKAV
jgi:hypothetical protein